MRKNSAATLQIVDAIPGKSYPIGLSTEGLGVLHQPGRLPRACIVHVEHGTVITLESIPFDLQDKFCVGYIEHTVFYVSPEGQDDRFMFEDGRFIGVAEFAHRNVFAYIGELEPLHEPVRLNRTSVRELVGIH
jgi:hypothetical protein